MSNPVTSSEDIRWGILGPGRAAARFAQGLAGVPRARLEAVWGRDEQRAQDFARRFSVPQVFTSLAEFLASPVEAVYVATHPDSHAELSIAALKAGKHVLC